MGTQTIVALLANHNKCAHDTRAVARVGSVNVGHQRSAVLWDAMAILWKAATVVWDSMVIARVSVCQYQRARNTACKRLRVTRRGRAAIEVFAKSKVTVEGFPTIRRPPEQDAVA